MPTSAKLYEIRKSKIQGRGAFALRFIPAGKRVAEYTGEIISGEEASERYDDAGMKRHHTFLFEVGDGMCIDAGPRGSGDAKYINHSCDPNCEAVMDGQRIFIDAKKDIEAGTELVYDYKYNLEGPIDEETRAIYACRCGARRCRGTILAPEKKRKTAKRGAGTKRKTKVPNGAGAATKTKPTAGTKAKTKSKLRA